MAEDARTGVSFHDLSAGGDVGALIREKDWGRTRLGPMSAWPRSLHNYVSMILELPTAAIVFWGPQQVQIYNDGYSVIMGPRHPEHLGSTFRDCWPEAYEGIHPWMQRVLHDGETVEVVRTLVPLTRFGFTEEAYFTFSFSPLRDDVGEIAGILQLVTEVTDAVLGERRASALHDLSNLTAHAKTTQDAARLAVDALGKYDADLPFCVVYTVDPDHQERMTLAGSTGLPADYPAFPRELESASASAIPELARVVRERRLVPIEDLANRFGSLPAGAWPEPPTMACACPITAADQQRIVAVLVVGTSPRLAFDGRYRSFVQLVCAHTSTLIAAARAYDDERQRAEALAEIDRAKTEFFSNVSHEFRTPLTLILGPLELALQATEPTIPRATLEALHRNALRLLRLVNTLLDFARLEANRLTPTFEPTDLPVLTAGLAGSFQSLLESAGLKLRVDCPAMPEPVYVDRSQWEKIVLNLITNAYKFTFEGEIGVRLRGDDGRVELSVSDTGTGIPPEELPKIFQRFHRVPRSRARSFEGTGIGLALVQELVKQHGGTVAVESTLGEGTTFVVAIPKRTEPTPGSPTPPTDAHASPVSVNRHAEAASWNAPAGDPQGETTITDADGQARARVLVADDNADMRLHLVRLLSPKWSVETAEDGQAALEAVQRRRPDLVLSDVMMPRMDGFELVKALRSDPATSTVPVILLSARAGEEAVLGGLESGVDDYLVKPFSARELLARVETHLHMADLRREWERELRHANDELETFSYSVSHDLRAPLRAIDGFSQVLLEDYADRLDDTGRRHLGRIRAAAQRMGLLIDDLLRLSRINAAPLVHERVDVTALAREILGLLAERTPERVVEASVEDGLVAHADRAMLAVLLENLLGNAWKFTSKTPLARIDVGREERDGETVFFVRDNGAGFSMAFANKLFVPFQRLHGQEEFPGTGIGLATVRRVVDRHRGRVWAEAALDRGATFYVALGPC